MKSIRTEIHIEAPPETVWQVLTDFRQYPDWNPFMPHAEGDIREGATIEVRIEPPGGRGMTFRPTLRRVEPNRELRWLGRLLLPKLFDGEHIFELHPAEEGTRFIQRENFGGLLVPLLWGTLEGATRRGFEAMNQALKERAEARGAASIRRS
jgi:hypothetical protein